MHRVNRPFFLIGTLGAILLVLNLFFIKLPFFGAASLLLYLAGTSRLIGFRMTKTTTAHEQWFFGACILVSTLILLNTTAYYLYGVNNITSICILFLPLLATIGKPSSSPKQKETHRKRRDKKKRPFPYLLLGFMALEIGLFGLIIANQTTDLLRSPWHALEPTFFAAYTLATALLFYFIFTIRTRTSALLFSIIHFFLTLGIAAIMYPLGFGFDAFIHRATESWIIEHGFIAPKTPYYIGQYSLVAFLVRLTSMPVFFVDVYLVPLLAAVSIPAGVSIFLKRIWNISLRRGLILAWLIPFVPFLNDYVHLTTPFNLAFLFAILSAFALVSFLKGATSFLIPALLAASALASHALVGAPLAVFALGAFLYKTFEQRQLTVAVLTGCAMTIISPTLFAVRNLMLGLGLPSIVAPDSRLLHFLELFARPYWYAKSAPPVFELLYGWAWCIVPIVLFFAFAGIYLNKKDRRVSLFFLTGAAGLLLSAWLLRTSIAFPDVAAYEQGDFPLRLIKLSLIFLLPFAMYALYVVMQKIQKRTAPLIISYTLIAAALTLSLYLSYPQHNPKARFPGLNVTRSDVDAVRWIHDRHEQYDYVVLSNQLTSAAALTEYSFAKYFSTDNGELFYYAIPTGGPLYQEYGRMLYEGQKREYMEAAMDLVDVNTAYFVVNEYWANVNAIVDGAKQSADSWHIIDDGAIWIFVYKK